MDISVLTLFPEMLKAYFAEGVIGRALEKDIFSLDIKNPRDYTTDNHRTVDDYPYGGGPGMVMKPEPIEAAMEDILSASAESGERVRTIMVTPSGRPFNQGIAKELSRSAERLVFISGRYEGIDQRVTDKYVDDELSIGDYVLTGGELPVLVIIDAIVRLLPGVVGDAESLDDESFSWGILDYPHYTRPADWQGMQVPDVLLSGNHAHIDVFRRKEALRLTMRMRPDLLEKEGGLTDIDRKLIREIKENEDESG